MYAVGALLAISFLPEPAQAAAAIAVLAFGDSAASAAGMLAGGPRNPLNTSKTLAGSAAFILCGGLAAFAFAGWPAFILAAGCSVLEAIDFKVDDNLTIPLAGIAFFLL
jgi:dolichol kinase